LAIDYDRLPIAYGPTFRAVKALWRLGDELFADLEVPGGGAYALHPALFDAALHASLFAEPDAPLRVPLTLAGVELYARGATSARAHIRLAGPDISVTMTDLSGRPLASVESVVTRPLAVESPAEAAARRGLYRLDWVPVHPGRSRGSYDVLDVPAGREVSAAVTDVLASLQKWLSGPTADRLVVVTHGVSADDPDLAGAAVAGMVCSAQSEHPDRMVLVDLCGAEDAIDSAVRIGEPEISVRDGRFFAPRLVSAGQPGEPRRLGGTVLITGGTGELGTILARHLVEAYDVEHVVVASRRGSAPVEGLPMTVVSCDITDRPAVEKLVASCAPDLTAVFHLAGVLDDGVLDAMTVERVHRVLAPKVDGAWHLHEATKDLPLSAFVLYSSASGLLGRPGQSNYAAANGFLDALARHRVARGSGHGAARSGAADFRARARPDSVRRSSPRRGARGRNMVGAPRRNAGSGETPRATDPERTGRCPRIFRRGVLPGREILRQSGFRLARRAAGTEPVE
jgi:NAD(P)-dependent dehydrogenase (short-subunit alcohol dehydrogenase family)